jgi:DAACS family dicarboxylate/amino acid:cation (Na+ or H+) symporter
LLGGRLDEQVSTLAGEPMEVTGPLVKYVMEPVGQVFLRMLLMTVVPLVFCSLAVGVSQLGDLSQLGRIGVKTLGYFLVTTAMATVIGLVLVNTIQPGVGLPQETTDALQKAYGGKASRTSEFGIDTFVKIVPKNPIESATRTEDMLSVIFFALLVGIGLTMIRKDRSQAVLRVLEGIGDLMVVIIGFAMKLAPYGVFALIFTTTSRLGFEFVGMLGKYVLVVITGLAIHFFGGFSFLLWTFSRLNPLWFFNKVRNVVVTAFSTSSSNATLPTSIKTAEEELGVPPQIAGFVLPLGATMNMNGTALFEGVTVVFLAQVFNVPLDFGQQAIVILMAVITAIGAAGVPGGSIPLLMMVLATVGVPEQGIALVLGVDRILDMCRTTLNVIGDLTAATFITRSEGLGFRLASEVKVQLGHREAEERKA